MHKFKRLISNPKRQFTDSECDDFAELMANNDDTGTMPVPVGAVFWLQFQPTHDSLNSKNNGLDDIVNLYTPAADLQGSYAEEGGWLYNSDGTFALHESGGLPRFDLGADNSREIMADFRGNENSFLRRMHLLACQTHNKLIGMGYSFEKARAANIAITNRITLEQTEMIVGEPSNAHTDKVKNLMDRDFHMSLEWNFAAARYAHAMCPAVVQGDDPLVKGRYALDVDVRALFDGSEMSKSLTPSVSIAMRDMASVPIKKNIIKRTLGRSVELNLPSYGEVARSIGMLADLNTDEQHLPIWAGILYEAARVNDGQALGPVGSVLISAGNMGHLHENAAKRDGLWYDLDDALPDGIMDLLDWLEV